jgi:carbonic anhydrase/acetyltransferase-like protein (isoleucine patch superfamily)
MIKIKTTLTVLIFMTFPFVSFSQTYTGNLTLGTQAEVDAFDYTEVTGYLVIRDNGSSITNLNALSKLTSVGSSLHIYFNDALTSLSGLENITSVNATLNIQDNAALTSLSGLENIISVKNLFISNNAALTSFSGLEKITSVGENLFISNNAALTSLSGLSNLTSVGWRLEIFDNADLTSLSGLSNLTSVGGESITSSSVFGKGLSIQNNAALTSLSGLSNLTSVGSFVGSSVGISLYIINNTALTSLSGLENITSVDVYLEIINNTALTSLSGLSNLTSVNVLFIYDNAALTSLSGLENITSVGGNSYIRNNAALTSLSGLENITSIGRDLKISNNAALTSLSGLENITSIGMNLEIYSNADLTSLCGISQLITNGQITSDEYFVVNNAYNPTYEEIQTNCIQIPEIVIETTNSTFSNDKILWSGTINDNSNFIKICADGTKSTKLTFINNSSVSNENIRFRTSLDNSDIINNGTFIDDYEITESINSITSYYTHPTKFSSNSNFIASNSIEIYDASNPSNVLFTQPLQIYKAPVLMIHGLWGNINSFNELYNYLNNNGYPINLMCYADYNATNDDSFSDNQFVVRDHITILLKKMRQNNYSAGKVDIISHSMGGILSRQHIQSSEFLNRINKLITLNSPHSGSPIGNLKNNSALKFLMPVIDKTVIKLKFGNNATMFDGAVDDLAIESEAMYELNVRTLNRNTVPSHTIATEFNVEVGTYLDIMGVIISEALDILSAEFFNNLFLNDAHDGIVTLLSQKGGLTENKTYNTGSSQPIFHTKSPKRIPVQSQIRILLNDNPQSSRFEQNGFSPTPLMSNYRLNQDNSFNQISNELIPNSISISAPFDESNFDLGETTDIEITSTNGINRIVFYAIDNLNENYFKEEFQNSQANLQYTISNDTYEDISFLALGFNDNGLVDYDIKTIGVNSNITQTGIEFSNSEIYIQKDFIAPISINVVYSNGDKRLLTDLSNVQLTVNDISIAEQFQTNMLKGNNFGSTTLSASYLTYSISTPVVVYESNIVMPDISTLSNTDFELPILDEDFLIYPNPNNGQFAIKLNLHPNEKIKIIVYNSIGQKISTFENELTDENSTKSISLKDLNSGIYYIKVFFGTDSKTGKVVIE